MTAFGSTPRPINFSVPEIRCAGCIKAIEDGLLRLGGVTEARVNATLRRVRIVSSLPDPVLIQALKGLGFEAYVLDAAVLLKDRDPEGRDLIVKIGVAGFAMMNVMLLSVAVWSGAVDATRDLFHMISACIALPAVLFSARPFFAQAWRALRVRRLNMDVPISLAIVLAAGMSLYETVNGGAHAYFDAALSLTFFLLIGRYLEHRTRSAARSAANELAALEVFTATRETSRGYETVPIEELSVGEVVFVATGMRVPVDGVLLTTKAQTDRSFLTGESEPVSHEQGASLCAGEINLGAPFDVRIDALGSDTRLRRIAEMVETAENARTGYTSLADRAARIYAPLVHVLAGLAFLGWYGVTSDVRVSLNVAIAVLIITCPCALGLAVPAVATAAISRLYQMGFLVKSGTALERLCDVDTVIFDKTGTMTRPGFHLDADLLDNPQKAVAKALAQASAHPLSEALTQCLPDIEPVQLADLVEVEGCGVQADWQGIPVALGRAEWLGHEGHNLALKIGETVVDLVYQDVPVSGAEGLSDALSSTGLSTEIVSGDSSHRTAALANHLSFANWRACLSPEEKTQHIAELQNGGQTVCMVGDGINDTAALAHAHVSIAPGTALDATRNAADIVMVGNTLSRLPELFDIASHAVSLSRQNFGIAILYNAVAIPIALAGFATPLMAALAMSFSSITVLLNALRVRRTR